MDFLLFLAQTAENYSGLLTYGPLGVITAWLMYRDEKRAMQLREVELRQIEKMSDMMHRIDGLTRAMLMDMLNRDKLAPAVKEYARQAIAKIDARAEKNE